MAQRPKNFKISSVVVSPAANVPPVRISPTAAVPAMFTALLRLEVPDVDVEVFVAAVNGNPPTVQKMTVWTRAGASLTSGTLRQVLLDPILRAAIAEASRPTTDMSGVIPGAYHVEGDPEHQVWVDTPPGATERVRQIARLYRDAVTAGSRSPGLDAANAVHISRAQAARYIKKARELRLLPPQEETVKAPAPGPHDPRVDPVANPPVKPDLGPSIFRDPHGPWPWEQKEELVQPVVAAIVTSELGVLVGRRNDGKPPWTFIAGEQDVVRDDRPENTAVREVKEETGLEVEAGAVIGERVHPKTGRTMIYIAASPVRGTDVYVGDEEELAEVRWVSLAELDELMGAGNVFGPVHEHLARELGE